MLEKEKILQLMRLHGPVLPKDLMKPLNTDTLLIGATLSEMASQGLINITSVKRGGSPFYYVPDHLPKLQDLSKFLNEKDQRAYALIREKKILKDNEITPLLRVSLRAIKDFARPVEVRNGETKDLFWAWYLISKEEYSGLIQQQYFPDLNAPKTSLPEPTSAAISAAPIDANLVTSLQKSGILSEPIASIISEAAPSDKVVSNKAVVEQSPALLKQKKKERKARKQSNPINIIQTSLADNNPSSTLHPVPTGSAISAQNTGSAAGQTHEQAPEINDELLDKIKSYFDKNAIQFTNIEIIRKNKEISCIVQVPSPVGAVEYYCRAKVKKRCNEGDLASLYVEAQNRKLPALLITIGEISKKAKEMLEMQFKNLKVVAL